MRRPSFRQTLLLGFLLVSLLLGAAALRGLHMLETFAERSRAAAAQAVQTSSDIQHLAERSVDLERSARQYLVLQAPELRTRYGDIHHQSGELLARLRALQGPAVVAAVDAWHEAAETAGRALLEKDGEATLAALARLATYNVALADAGRQWIDTQNAQLHAALEHNRFVLLIQVLTAIVATLATGAAIGWWAVRPVATLESAIERLGEGRFDAAITIRGPADLQRLGQRLDWLRRRLAELEADRVRVLRHVSHELKTPLAALREGVSLLQEEVVGPLTPDQRDVARILEQNARALQRQIEDLLAYHAAVFDAGRVERQRVVIGELLDEVADGQRLQLQARQVRVAVDVGKVAATVDADKLRVVLANLLSNAISFSPVGGEIRLSATLVGGALRIDCADAGPGVAPEDVAHIFEPFYQGRRQPDVSRQGSGVGLSIVRELVVAQGGTVALLPSETGAHFRVEFPDA